MDTTLVVMAAGMGSRFGGLKQMEPVGRNGEVLLDYSIYDAKKAGFNKVCFIIKKEIEEDFRRLVGSRIEKKIDVSYVMQSTDNLPAGRVKPWAPLTPSSAARIPSRPPSWRSTPTITTEPTPLGISTSI